MTRLREQMKMELELKGYSDKTQSAYINHVKNYASFFEKSPDKLCTEHDVLNIKSPLDLMEDN